MPLAFELFTNISKTTYQTWSQNIIIEHYKIPPHLFHWHIYNIGGGNIIIIFFSSSKFGNFCLATLVKNTQSLLGTGFIGKRVEFVYFADISTLTTLILLVCY